MAERTEIAAGALVTQEARNQAPVTMRAVQRRDTWRASDRQAFLEVLAATANISQAARAVGRTSPAAHRLRIKDAAFAADWKAALESACEAIHAAAVAEGLRSANGGYPGGDPCPTCGAMPQPFDQALAFRILSLQETRNARPIEPKRGNYRPVPIEEVEAALTKRIAAIVRKRNPA